MILYSLLLIMASPVLIQPSQSIINPSLTPALDGIWYPLFVTADLPIEVINTILCKAVAERWRNNNPSSALVGNPWVLIQTRNQEGFSAPTNPPVEPFQNDFIGTPTAELADFVEVTFGETGRGRQPGIGYIWNTQFGVLDTRTAADGTLDSYIWDSLLPVEEAAFRVQWGGATRRDEALVRYKERDATPEDLEILVQDMKESTGFGDVRRYGAFYAKQNNFSNGIETMRDQWLNARLRADIAGQSTVLLGLDPVGWLTTRKLFDEHGVMRDELVYD